MLFSKPRHRVRPVREVELLARGERFELGGRLAAWQWGTGPAVLLVHGWEGRGAQLGALVDPLVQAGYRVVTFDAPAHGDSPGSLATIADFRDAVSAMYRHAHHLHGIVAHSLGCPATALALHDGVKTDSLVFLAGPATLEPAFLEFSRRLNLSDQATEAFKHHAAESTGIDFASLRAAALAPPCPPPLLVVHDRSDRAVPTSDGQEIVEHWPGATLWLTEGLGHQRILRDAEVVRRATDFVASVPVDAHCSELDRRFSLGPLGYG
jgi:pimeloyl-ACP methyl ester carboxylesterase